MTHERPRDLYRFDTAHAVEGWRAIDARVMGVVDGVIEARGDGTRYNLYLFAVDAFDALSHRAEFSPAAHAWDVIRLPIAAFRATVRGRQVPDVLAVRIDQVELGAVHSKRAFLLHWRELTDASQWHRGWV
ncbi:MAG: CIA30 family protein [Pseudomonadota bacterium]|nr:CIA30 family protein [Pseudomonadota bacterium]